MATTRSMATVSRRNIKRNSEDDRSQKKSSQYFAKPSATKKLAKKRRKVVTASPSSSSSSRRSHTVIQTAVERTQSFDPVSHHTFHPNSNLKIHTLLLGTHPSIKSLAQSEYFGHPLNAFWWIAGDALGFRRDTGISPSSNKPYKLTEDLFYSEEYIIPYDEQLQKLTSHGFAMWDILKSCKRKGSLDLDIKEEIPNNIRDFCKDHPSIQRIVLCNGTSGATFFNRHFKEWWRSGELKPASNVASIRAFQKFEKIADDQFKSATIEVVCGIGVSPAAASYSYSQKRDFYKKYCFDPGLKLLEESMYNNEK